MYKKIKKLIDDNNLDAVIINNPLNTLYLTNFKSSNAIFLITKNNQKFFFTDSRYLSQAEKFFDAKWYFSFAFWYEGDLSIIKKIKNRKFRNRRKL